MELYKEVSDIISEVILTLHKSDIYIRESIKHEKHSHEFQKAHPIRFRYLGHIIKYVINS